MIIQFSALICYAGSNQFSGGSFDGYDDSIFFNSGSSSNNIKYNQRYGGGAFDGYSDAVLIQSSGGGSGGASSKHQFSGGSFDGYDKSVFRQSNSSKINLNACFTGGSFDGYDNSIFTQSRSDNKNMNCCYQGGSFDGYDYNYFDYPTPYIKITNSPALLFYSQTTAQISGTNLNISGQLAWINNIFPDVTNWFDQGFDVEVTGIVEGSNTIEIIGANYLSNYVSDSVVVYRETFADVHPFIKITNAPSEVAYNISSAEISGTNLNIAGEMWWTNTLTGGSGTIQISNFIFQVLLDHGDNFITVSGTNIYGQSTNDVVCIRRKTSIDVHPFIKITNENVTVNYNIASYTIGGTNNANVVGGITWTNSLTGESGDVPIINLGFQISNIALDHGDNLMTVTGTNIYGQSTNSVVSIHRKTLIESEPRIATNALICPEFQSILHASVPTNIIWEVGKITDDMDATNLTITKIELYYADTTNFILEVTNNIANVLGEIEWIVSAGSWNGKTNCVLKFEVVNSLSLTNSRIFFDNVFVIVPEPACLLFIIYCLLFISRKKYKL